MNKNNKPWIRLEWFGPIPFKEFKNDKIKYKYKELKENGIYLICIHDPISNKYLITYVGSAERGNSCIYDRVNCWLYNPKTFLKISEKNNEVVVDIENNYLYNSEIDDNLKKDNIEKCYIFFAIPNEETLKKIKEYIGLQLPIRQIEGAIRHLIRKNMITRKYDITTENPGYHIKPFELENKILEKGIEILGFES